MYSSQSATSLTTDFFAELLLLLQLLLLKIFGVLVKTLGLYQVPKLRNLNLIFFDGGTDGRTTDGVTYTIRWSRMKI